MEWRPCRNVPLATPDNDFPPWIRHLEFENSAR